MQGTSYFRRCYSAQWTITCFVCITHLLILRAESRVLTFLQGAASSPTIRKHQSHTIGVTRTPSLTQVALFQKHRRSYSFHRPTSTSHNASSPTKLCDPLVSRYGRLIHASYAPRLCLLRLSSASSLFRDDAEAGGSPDCIKVGTSRRRCCVEMRYCVVRSEVRSTVR